MLALIPPGTYIALLLESSHKDARLGHLLRNRGSAAASWLWGRWTGCSDLHQWVLGPIRCRSWLIRERSRCLDGNSNGGVREREVVCQLSNTPSRLLSYLTLSPLGV